MMTDARLKTTDDWRFSAMAVRCLYLACVCLYLLLGLEHTAGTASAGELRVARPYNQYSADQDFLGSPGQELYQDGVYRGNLLDREPVLQIAYSAETHGEIFPCGT